MSNFDLTLSVALGIGLAAATGFRLFLPLLILSGAAYTGHASLNEGFAWLGTPTAVIMLGTAAVVEIAAFYIPGVDNLLDTVATPSAVVAGTIVSAAVMTDLPPTDQIGGSRFTIGYDVFDGDDLAARARSGLVPFDLARTTLRRLKPCRAGDAHPDLALGRAAPIRFEGPVRSVMIITSRCRCAGPIWTPTATSTT